VCKQRIIAVFNLVGNTPVTIHLESTRVRRESPGLVTCALYHRINAAGRRTLYCIPSSFFRRLGKLLALALALALAVERKSYAKRMPLRVSSRTSPSVIACVVPERYRVRHLTVRPSALG
jgi:hypothetical protein